MTRTPYEGGWTLMRSGRRFNFKDPTFPDTARALIDEAGPGLRQYRFSGGSDLTIADHLCMTAWLAARCGYDDATVFWAAVHDLHEAWFGDISGPLKRLIGPPIKVIELNIEIALRAHLIERGAPAYSPEIEHHVKGCDLQAQQIERDRYLPQHPDWPRSSWGLDEFLQFSLLPVHTRREFGHAAQLLGHLTR